MKFKLCSWSTLWAATGLLSTLGGCHHATTEASPSVDVDATSRTYAAQDGAEAPFQPGTQRMRHLQLSGRRVRYRHAGPR